MSKKFMECVFLALIILILFANKVSAQNKASDEKSLREFPLSFLYTNMEIVVQGNVVGVEIEPNNYKMSLAVREVFHGNFSDTSLVFVAKIANGFPLSDEPYLAEGTEVILFLNQNEGGWKATEDVGGVFHPGFKSDVLLTLQKYSTNNQLFEKEYVLDQQDLFFDLTTLEIKWRVLLDIRDNLHDMRNDVNSKHVDFLRTLLNSEVLDIVIYSIGLIGNLRLEEMRLTIEDILQNSTNQNIKFHCIGALGRIGNKESFNLILPYLDSEIQNLKHVASSALGEIGDIRALEPLKQLFYKEPDWLRRNAIVGAISNLSDKRRVLVVLRYLLLTESDIPVIRRIEHEIERVKSFINREILNEELLVNYPNPFNPSTRIIYSLETEGTVKIIIYDIAGRVLKVIVDEVKGPGVYETVWNGRNAVGTQVASGTYIYRFTVDGKLISSKRMILIR